MKKKRAAFMSSIVVVLLSIGLVAAAGGKRARARAAAHQVKVAAKQKLSRMLSIRRRQPPAIATHVSVPLRPRPRARSVPPVTTHERPALIRAASVPDLPAARAPSPEPGRTPSPVFVEPPSPARAESPVMVEYPRNPIRVEQLRQMNEALSAAFPVKEGKRASLMRNIARWRRGAGSPPQPQSPVWRDRPVVDVRTPEEIAKEKLARQRKEVYSQETLMRPHIEAAELAGRESIERLAAQEKIQLGEVAGRRSMAQEEADVRRLLKRVEQRSAQMRLSSQEEAARMPIARKEAIARQAIGQQLHPMPGMVYRTERQLVRGSSARIPTEEIIQREAQFRERALGIPYPAAARTVPGYGAPGVRWRLDILPTEIRAAPLTPSLIEPAGPDRTRFQHVRPGQYRLKDVPIWHDPERVSTSPQLPTPPVAAEVPAPGLEWGRASRALIGELSEAVTPLRVGVPPPVQ